MKLKDQVAVVTGSSRGLGRATVIEFAREGAKVVVNYPIDAEENNANDVVAQVQSIGREALKEKADVSDFNQVKGMMDRVANRFGRIDILVNNAGIEPNNAFDTMTIEQWNEVISINLTGLFNCTRCVIEQMKSQKAGRIINISSCAAFLGRENSDYIAAKAGILGFTRSIAKTYGKYGIRCNTICPGAHKTDIWNKVVKEEGGVFRSKAAIDDFIKAIPLGFLAEPISIAKAALFLASEEDSAYITGHNLVVDGGLTLR